MSFSRTHLLTIFSGICFLSFLVGLLPTTIRGAELATLPKPQNVKIFADDQIATVTWDEPDTASTNKIVGYYVT